ncbi:class I SAM-dependent methyltransferase [Evansella cellulosilytica]|uniref:Methyltransferase type 11 n=1 Tax=Evansella cellulosilytica (strain ATCC 21833 / DSM 2522 / FERM P-1141 / JCM 9156 / N-4) TaxID=649639 RepID=E6TVR2_EVAC2|nr:class I SAM-dependent methyltransferase [Evansella cellulosilytica]ADU32190.1 Methyltransferase type 11 [Evansella cellulosilytica DSM 2522]
MGIDFHSKKNKTSYTTREADKSWIEAMQTLLPIDNITSATDVGCGGGIYLKALYDIGISAVTGVDFSKTMLEAARENCKDYPNITFQHGTAFETTLENNNYELLLERALIHHIKAEDLSVCFEEGHRVLKDGGHYIIQDRTPEDCLLEGSDTHIRGYFFELFPKLIEKETKRRHSSAFVRETLKKANFKQIEEITLWEKRQTHETKAQLLKDISERTGRSILHELTDDELSQLVNHLDKTIKTNTNIVEKDRWTIWKAVK